MSNEIITLITSLAATIFGSGWLISALKVRTENRLMQKSVDNAEFDGMKNEIAFLTETLDKKNEADKKLRELINDLNKMITEQSRKITELEGRVAEMDSKICEHRVCENRVKTNKSKKDES